MTDYEFYSKNFLAGRGAVIDSASFPFWERKASNEVRKYTFGNINETKPIPEDVKLCVCEVAEILFKNEKEGRTDGVLSEKVGEYSVTYANKDSAEALNSKIAQTIRTWLLPTGLMYCGVM